MNTGGVFQGLAEPFLQTKAAAVQRRGIYFGEGLCLPSHAALTSAGAQGLGLGKEEGAQRVEVGPGMKLFEGKGVGRMLHSGCCLALKSHLALTRSGVP